MLEVQIKNKLDIYILLYKKLNLGRIQADARHPLKVIFITPKTNNNTSLIFKLEIITFLHAPELVKVNFSTSI
jgi:hypothetical protein